MTEKDKQAFVETLTGLAEILGGQLSKVGLKLYWESLKDLTIEEFKMSANRIARENKFFPRLSEIREMAKPKIDKALLAWTTVMQAVNKFGYDKTVSFEDRVINSVIKQGWTDWDKFCSDYNDRDIEWMQKEFERLYELCKSFKGHPDKLLGYHDLHNVGRGYKEKEVFKISSGGKKVEMIGGKKE